MIRPTRSIVFVSFVDVEDLAQYGQIEAFAAFLPVVQR